MVDVAGLSPSDALYRRAREIQQMATAALERATPGPRRDCAIAKAELAEVAKLAEEASRG